MQHATQLPPPTLPNNSQWSGSLSLRWCKFSKASSLQSCCSTVHYRINSIPRHLLPFPNHSNLHGVVDTRWMTLAYSFPIPFVQACVSNIFHMHDVQFINDQFGRHTLLCHGTNLSPCFHLRHCLVHRPYSRSLQ